MKRDQFFALASEERVQYLQAFRRSFQERVDINPSTLIGELHSRPWGEIAEARKQLRKAAGDLCDKAGAEKRSLTEHEERAFECASALIDAISGEMDYRDSIGDRSPRKEPGEKRAAEDTAGEPRKLVSWSGKHEAVEYKTRRGGPEIHIRTNWPTFADSVRAILKGRADNELEARALSEGTPTAGGHTVPQFVMPEFIDRLRPASVVLQAGARTIGVETNSTKMARLTGSSTVAWRNENASITPQDLTMDAVTFTPQSLAGLVQASFELVQDSVNIEDVINTDFTGSFGSELDRVALIGSGSAPEPRGVFNASGIASVDMATNGATLAASGGYDKLLDLAQALLDANAAAALDGCTFVMAPRTAVQLAKLKEATTNAPLAKPSFLDPVRMLVTTGVPTNQTLGSSGTVASSIIAGWYQELIVAVRQALEIRVLRERYADNGQLGFLAMLRADVQLRQPGRFGRLRGIL